jgi:site-specific DNA recombinase
MSEKQRAVIYARYSSAGQREESIEGQIRVCQEYAGRSDIDVVGEYIDRGMTGTNTSRPQFQKMIHDSKNRRFDVVLVYKLDRFTRNRFDSAIYKNKLKANDVKVISATESISDAPEGIILEANLEAFAEYYSKELSQKILRGNRENLLAGKYTGGNLPFGFKATEDKHVLIDEEEARIVRRIFEEYDGGSSVKKILERLSKDGHRTRRGYNFSYHFFESCIRNRKYTGRVTYQGEEWNNIFPAIITDELFDSVNKKYGRRKVKPSTKAKERFLLTGKLYCSECDNPYTGDSGTSKSGATHSYYTCAGRKTKKICDRKRERKNDLEEFVTSQTLSYVLTDPKKEYIADELLAIYKKDFNSLQVDRLKREVKNIDRKIDKAFEIMMAATNQEVIDRAGKQTDLLAAQKAEMESEIAKLEILCKMKYTKKEILQWLNSFDGEDPTDKQLQEKVIDTFVNSVYIGEAGAVIYYNIKNGASLGPQDNAKLLDINASKSSLASSIGEARGIRTPNQQIRKVAFWLLFPVVGSSMLLAVNV